MTIECRIEMVEKACVTEDRLKTWMKADSCRPSATSGRSAQLEIDETVTHDDRPTFDPHDNRLIARGNDNAERLDQIIRQEGVICSGVGQTQKVFRSQSTQDPKRYHRSVNDDVPCGANAPDGISFVSKSHALGSSNRTGTGGTHS